MIDMFQKVQMFNLNMNYPIKNYSIDVYTNYLINNKMNEFVKTFEKDKDKLFVLDYKDDLISLICYRILKNLQQVSPFKFQIAICGKVKQTKKYIVKKEKKINNWALRRQIKKDNVIIIQPFNPIYEVAKTGISFKTFSCQTWQPIKHFTPAELKQTQLFYQLGYFKKDKIQIDVDPLIQQFNRFCCGEKNSIDFFEKEYQNNIALIKLTGNNDEDQKLLNEVEDFNGLVFYFYNNDYPQLLDSEFSLFLKNKANIPDESNVNNCDMVIEILRTYDSKPIYYGEWSSTEKIRYK